MGRPKRILNLCDPVFAAYVPELSNHLRALGYGAKSVKRHERQVQIFLYWLESIGIHCIESVKLEQLENYRECLTGQVNQNDGGSLHPKTVYSHLRSVQLLFDLLLQTGRLVKDPMSRMALRYPSLRGRRMILDKMEIERLYEACETLSERALLGLTYGCGLRACELERVEIEDVRFDDNVLVVPRGKNNKRRIIPLSESVKRDLLSYQLRQRRYVAKSQTAFLLHSRGERMRAYTANKYLRNLAKRGEVKMKAVSVHVLRHSIATHLLENGLAVDQVRQFLGHALLATTEIYTRVSQRQIRQLVS
jgi:integrase/recombinase XerD